MGDLSAVGDAQAQSDCRDDQESKQHGRIEAQGTLPEQLIGLACHDAVTR